MRIQYFVAAAALAAFALPASAQSLKPGLWEMNHKMGGNAQMDQAMAEMAKQMAAMPPEQRKQMEAMMAQRGMQMPQAGKGGGMAMKVCMTKEQVERGEAPMQEGCRVTTMSRSGNTTRMAYTCTNPPSSGEGQFTYHSPEAYSSKMLVRTQVEGKTEQMTMEGSGKWLGADCGAIKPAAPPKK
jgi:hypothetical protein